MKPRPKPQSIKEADANAYIDQGGSVQGMRSRGKRENLYLARQPGNTPVNRPLDQKKRDAHFKKLMAYRNRTATVEGRRIAGMKNKAEETA